MIGGVIGYELPEIVTARGVYEPASDSRLLLETFSGADTGGMLDVLDLCCGSGVQGIAAALRGHMVDAVDADQRAVAAARDNAERNFVAMRVMHGDLFEPVTHHRYDAVLCNPPYVPTPAGSQPVGWCDGGPDGRELIDRISAQVTDVLKPGGSLWMVHSSLAGIARTRRRLMTAGLEVDDVAWRTEPLGPVSRARHAYLVGGGFMPAHATTEELVVFRATLPG